MSNQTNSAPIHKTIWALNQRTCSLANRSTHFKEWTWDDKFWSYQALTLQTFYFLFTCIEKIWIPTYIHILNKSLKLYRSTRDYHVSDFDYIWSRIKCSNYIHAWKIVQSVGNYAKTRDPYCNYVKAVYSSFLHTHFSTLKGLGRKERKTRIKLNEPRYEFEPLLLTSSHSFP